MILHRISTASFPKSGQKASSCPLSLPHGDRHPKSPFAGEELNVWSEITKAHKQVLKLSFPHVLLSLMLRMKRVLSSFKKTIRLSTIFNHLETKHENPEDTLEMVLSSALVLKMWNRNPRDSSK